MRNLLLFTILAAFAMNMVGCDKRNNSDDKANVANETMLAPEYVITDPILIEFNTLLNKWEILQNSENGSPKERESFNQLKDRSVIHFLYLVRICGLDNEAEILIASTALGFSKNSKAIPVLLKLLKHKNDDIVANAALALGLIADKTTPIQPITALLQHRDPNVRSKAGFVLTHIVDEHDSRGTLFPLIDALSDTEVWVKVNCLNALATIKDKRAISAIIEHCISHADPRVRFAAASTLGHIAHTGVLINIPSAGIHEESPIDELIILLDDEHKRVNEAAHWALRRISREEIDPDRDQWNEWFLQEQQDAYIRYIETERRKKIEAKQLEKERLENEANN